MNRSRATRLFPIVLALAAISFPGTVLAQSQTTRVIGVVREASSAIPLPGIPVEVVGTSQVVYTDVDGKFVLPLPNGSYEIKIAMDGYQTRTIKVDVKGEAREIAADVTLSVAGLDETVTVTADFVNAETSSAAAQLFERKNAQVITDNIGSQQMKLNGDSDAAGAMARVTGMSLVDNQYIFVRGLGERYSNTTLAGSVLPTTEPDKKVVPLDLFPTGLIDSVQVAKSYSAEKSAEFAGGLVQIVPLKLPSGPVVDLSYGLSIFSTATGKDILLSPLGSRDWLGYDNQARALPGTFPTSKIVRSGVFTPEVGYSAEQITALGRQLGNTWRPERATGAPGQNWGVVLGSRFGKLGVIASATHSYKEQFVEERRRFLRVADDNQLEPVSDYDMQFGTQKAQLGIVGNLSYQFSTNHRLSLENFYSHSGRDEGRHFEGPNFENNFYFRNERLQFVEEGLMSNAVSGEHFFQQLANSRVDWRVTVARADRNEPDLRETLYQATLNADGSHGAGFLLADESQSGFLMFNDLEDQTVDAAANWSLFRTANGRAMQFKVGASYVERTRDFQSRRFRFIPISANKDAAVGINLGLAPEQLFAASNIGTIFRFNEETRPTDAYDGDQTTSSGYAQIDLTLTMKTRLIAGARVERFHQRVNTLDPFGLFEAALTTENTNTDVFPGINLVQTLRPNMNLRVSYSTTVNRPEFRELAEFEFTDVVGNRAVRGNPELTRALIQNVDGRWETFFGSEGVLAASVFYKFFDQPIERVVIAAANPIVTFRNADTARNFGFELEAGHDLGRFVFFNANYTFVDSEISLRPEQRTVQTSLERPLAGQSKNLFNVMGEVRVSGFSARALVNYSGDRISDVGANQAPDIVEQGRGSLDVVVSQRFGPFGLRLNLENLTDSEYLFTQGAEDQRAFKLGRTIGVSASYNLF